MRRQLVVTDVFPWWQPLGVWTVRVCILGGGGGGGGGDTGGEEERGVGVIIFFSCMLL